jgi:hypothetical protein
MRWSRASGAFDQPCSTKQILAEQIRSLPTLRVSAQSRHFLNDLIADPIKAAVLYRSGVLVQIPRQAAFLIGVLAEDRPEDLAEAHEVGIGSGVKWWDRIAASLKRMPQSFAILEALQAAPCPRSGKCRGIVARRETGVYHRANV